MSMTHEEAIKHLIRDWDIKIGCDFVIKPGRLEDFLAALDVALSALRPITREQVEKVWKGEWLNFYNDFSTAECSKCGELFDVSDTDENLKVLFDAFKKYYRFCPNCGAPMTDEAVDMVIGRREELYETI